MEKRLYRSREDRSVAGVAGGLAEYFQVDPTLVRILFVIFTIAGGPGLLLYVILWIVMPEEPSYDYDYIEGKAKNKRVADEY